MQITPSDDRGGTSARLRLSCWVLGALGFLLAASGPALAQQTPATSGCQTCHAELEDAEAPGPALRFGNDVHAQRGFTCVDCHGGNPDTDDMELAKAASAGFRGAPGPADQIAMCGRCHSDAAFMRRYSPRLRVDQVTEYQTSVHGQQLAKGDTKVATCTSCHGVHDIRLVSDAKSRVYPTNVALTCAACHASSEHMQGYEIAEGTPLPVDQFAEYQRSVHYEAMTVGNDLSAPTCNDCHGNHGAAPPGVSDVANVCGTCHAVFASRFAVSTHSELFNCAECHGNHEVHQPSDALLGTTSGAVCVTCHSEGDAGFEAAAAMRSEIENLKGGIDRAAALTAQVHNAGMEVTDQELALGEARNQLTLARTEIHAFDPAVIRPVIEEGLARVRSVEEAGAGQLEELRYRRRGLGWSLAAILLLVVALFAKIRQIDRSRGVRDYVAH